MVRLSNSAIDKFKECPQRYKRHYIDKLRSVFIGSPLFFGSAVDEALNELLKTKMKSNKEEIRDPFEVFHENMNEMEYNKEILYLAKSLKSSIFKPPISMRIS